MTDVSGVSLGLDGVTGGALWRLGIKYCEKVRRIIYHNLSSLVDFVGWVTCSL